MCAYSTCARFGKSAMRVFQFITRLKECVDGSIRQCVTNTVDVRQQDAHTLSTKIDCLSSALRIFGLQILELCPQMSNATNVGSDMVASLTISSLSVREVRFEIWRCTSVPLGINGICSLRDCSDFSLVQDLSDSSTRRRQLVEHI